MRVAVCFAGHLRQYRRNYSLVPFLFDANAAHSFDVFVHTYSTLNTPAPVWHDDNGGGAQPVDSGDLTWIVKNVPHVRAIEVDTARGGDERLPPGCEKVGGRWSLQRGQLMRRAYQRLHGIAYDLVLCWRFDVLLEAPLVLAPPEAGVIHGPYNQTAVDRGVDGDVTMWGPPAAIDAWAVPAVPDDLVAAVPSYGFVGEMLNTEIRRRAGLRYEAVRVPISILRTWGDMVVPR